MLYLTYFNTFQKPSKNRFKMDTSFTKILKQTKISEDNFTKKNIRTPISKKLPILVTRLVKVNSRPRVYLLTCHVTPFRAR